MRRWLAPALGLLVVVALVAGAWAWSGGLGGGGLTIVAPPADAAVGQPPQEPAVTVARRDFQIRLSFDAQTAAGSTVELTPHPGLSAAVPSWQRRAEPDERSVTCGWPRRWWRRARPTPAP